VAGSDQRGSVTVGGLLRRGGGVLGVVLLLEAEAREVAMGTVLERGENTAWGGEKNLAGGGRQLPFKGGAAGHT
jgi:hypothetical protein